MIRRPSPDAGAALVLATALAFALHPASFAENSAAAPTPRPGWAATARVGEAEVPVEHSERYTFVLPKRHPFCLVEIPATLEDGRWAEQFGVRAGESWLRCRLVHRGPHVATLLIDASSVNGDDVVVEIYPLGHAEAPPPAPKPTEPDAFRSPQPISCEFRKTRFPTETSNENVLFGDEVAMLRRGKAERTMVADIAAANGRGMTVARGEGKRRGGPGDLLSDIRTMLLVEEPGTYLLALKSPGAAAVLLGRDEEPVARSFRRFPAAFRGEKTAPMPTEWSLGREVELAPGVHPLHVASLTPVVAEGCFELGWLRPGAKDIEPIPTKLFLSGQSERPVVRHERRDGAIQVSFRTRLSPPYRFASTNVAFQLLTAAPRVGVWVPVEDADPPRWEWLVDGVCASSTPTPLVVPLTAGRHEVALQIQFRGELFTSTQTVYSAGVPGREYRVAAAPNGIEPILREDDVLRPDLWITGDEVGIQAELRVRMRDGMVRTVADTVTPERQWARLEAPSLPVGEADGLSWTLRHGGILLDEGSLDLVRPPFREIPSGIAGTILHAANGRMLSYVVPSGAEDGAPPSANAGDGAPVVWLTDFLLPDGADMDGAQVVRLASLRRDEGEGLSTVASLCGLDAIPVGVTAVVALGLESWIGRRTPEQLERSLAALARLLRDARGARVIVCTLPPLDGDAAALRPYAAAALRAAKSCGVASADLYSGFLNTPAGPPLVDGIRITEEGVRRASEIVGRIVVPLQR